MLVAQMAFFQLSRETTMPYGDAKLGSHYQNQAGPTASRYPSAAKVRPL
jgi:deoxycytidine triphosphate deaminase